MQHSYRLGENCFCCGKDVWYKVKEKNLGRYFLLTGCSREGGLFGYENKKTGKKMIFGISFKGKHICTTCFEILIKMEEFYDKFYTQIIDDHIEDIRRIRNNLIGNKPLTAKRFLNADCGLSKDKEFIKNLIKGLDSYD